MKYIFYIQTKQLFERYWGYYYFEINIRELQSQSYIIPNSHLHQN